MPVSPLTPAIESVIRRSLDRIHAVYPDTRAILLKGSLVRGDAGPYSDIDLDVLVDALDEAAYLAWFEEEAGRLHHVSIAVHTWETWWEDAAEPAAWAMGLAAQDVFLPLWTRTWRPVLRPRQGRNALLRGDALGIRLAAQGVGRLCPTVLAVVNPGYPSEPVTSPRAALDAILAFPVAPDGYLADLLCCLGLTDGATSISEVAAAAERLVSGVIALLEDHAAWSNNADDPHYEVGLDTALANRTLRAYVHQIHLSTGE
ncbi:MAG: nucleotidyltransferase domain-containing protein [Thermomicrobiales bacterium]